MCISSISIKNFVILDLKKNNNTFDKNFNKL